MRTSTTSRRAFLEGSAVAVGGLLMADRVAALISRSFRSGESLPPYLLDLPHPPPSGAVLSS
jgi:hypothetical protein